MTHSIRVSLSKRQDWFFATSDDLRGLFVANPSLAVVYEEIPEAIKLLFKVQHGVDVVVSETAIPEKRPVGELVYSAELRQAA